MFEVTGKKLAEYERRAILARQEARTPMLVAMEIFGKLLIIASAALVGMTCVFWLVGY